MDIIEAIQILNATYQLHARAVSTRELREAEKLVKRSETYRPLTPAEGRKIAFEALSLFDNNKGGAAPLHILTNVSDVVSSSLEGLYPLLLTRALGWDTDSFFREADSITRDTIIRRLDSGKEGTYSCTDMLCALAWIGDEEVQRKFSYWRQNPPSWSLPLPSPLSRYTLAAGWELTPAGTRRNLYIENSYDIISSSQAKSNDIETSNVLFVGNLQSEVCGWCRQPLLTLFDINLNSSTMSFLGIEGKRLRIPICVNCSFQFCAFEERLYMDVDWNGNAYWSLINGKRPSEVELFEEEHNKSYVVGICSEQFTLGEKRRTPFERFGSHIGGCPGWLQGQDYPSCPKCRETMIFIGQLNLDEINFESYGLEGYIYVFLCTTCKKSTIGIQH